MPSTLEARSSYRARGLSILQVSVAIVCPQTLVQGWTSAFGLRSLVLLSGVAILPGVSVF